MIGQKSMKTWKGLIDFFGGFIIFLFKMLAIILLPFLFIMFLIWFLTYLLELSIYPLKELFGS